MRFLPLAFAIFVTLAATVWAGWQPVWPAYTLLAVAGALSLVGLFDLVQQRHTLLRNYPLIGHMRWLLEGVRPQIRQYFMESDTDGTPFNRSERTLVYERAKDELDNQPFGTELDVYAAGYEWINHSVNARTTVDTPMRVDIGGSDCGRPYSASVYNISAMSFGSLGAAAVRALNLGAKRGNFAQDTGEGGISRYHREAGGDLIWEIGTGYFGCRTRDGHFDANAFTDKAQDDQVSMIEVKISQGAKPGHGGILPGAKVTPEIAEARQVAPGEDCISPPGHSAFTTPIELLEFIANLRDKSAGKPTGFKLCVGNRWEVMAICKAMLETGIKPDFIVVDGAEGGTGAAPVEHSNNIGMPLRDGLLFLQNALVGSGLRDDIRIGASGKVITAAHLAVNLAIGADWCNSARGFMFALGCVQSLRCHSNRCPTGVTTQDPVRQRALYVPDKAERVYNYHRNMLGTLGQVLGAAGVGDCAELRPHHVCRRISETEYLTLDRAYTFLARGELMDGASHEEYRRFWDMARPDSFAPVTAVNCKS